MSGLHNPNLPNGLPSAAGSALNSKLISERQMLAGVFVGLFLVVLGTTILFMGRNQVASSLTICVGFGIVLAMFGTQVSGRWAGWSATGAGATAVLLFLVLQQFTDVPVPNDFIKGSLEGDFSKVADLRIIDEHPMYVYRDRSTSTIRFLNVGRDLKSRRVRMQVDTIEKNSGREFYQLYANSDLFEERMLGHISSGDEFLQLTFDYENRVVMDGEVVLFEERDTLARDSSPKAPQSADFSLFGISARAEAAAVGPENLDLNPTEIGTLIDDLKSEEIYRRRNARDLLVRAGPSAVNQLTDAFVAASGGSVDDYRIRVGVTYILSEMLRTDETLRTDISNELTTDEFPYFVEAAADEDKTIRYQAAEFLYLLEDPRSVSSSLDAVKESSSRSVDNQVLILRESAKGLDVQRQDMIIEELSRSDRYKTLDSPTSALRNIFKW
ncbi:hypothetical protein [Roseibium marinum]|uniref:HEAT repeat domain-containing protein n=1 Tax=Roseibium marinum TaxID=281252 RepID=A0A2S3US65_9HYPH|nr:hypothetical protein [Roseibium marinum]POF30565.1 hypothetical protein CLV41_106179 [Roseibium marinum]